MRKRARQKRAAGVEPAPPAEHDRGLLTRVPAGDMRPDPARGALRRFWDWLRCQPAPTPRPPWIGPVEPPPGADDADDDQTPRIGICCSGGGIRSAAFNLGALQTLQGQGKLDDARYLAAVS